MIGPIFETLSDQTPSAGFYKVDIETADDIALEATISTVSTSLTGLPTRFSDMMEQVPTVIAYKGGSEVGRTVGPNFQQLQVRCPPQTMHLIPRLLTATVTRLSSRSTPRCDGRGVPVSLSTPPTLHGVPKLVTARQRGSPVGGYVSPRSKAGCDLEKKNKWRPVTLRQILIPRGILTHSFRIPPGHCPTHLM